MTGSRDRFGLGVTNCRPARQVIENVRAAENLGAEVAFVSEDVNCRDAFELLAAAALQTETIRLAAGVVNPYTRNPTSLAMAIATLDELSAGRALLGIGTSTPSLIQRQMGIPAGKGLEAIREAAEIVRGLLTGKPVTYPGKRFVYWEAVLEAKPTQEHIPIFFAAMGPRMLRLAGALADGVLLNVGASTTYVRWAIGEIRVGAEQAGRTLDDLTIAAWLSVYLTDDYEDGLRRAREWLASSLSVPRQGELLLDRGGIDSSILVQIRRQYSHYPPRGDKVKAAKHVPPQVAEQLTLIGNRRQIEARLADYRAAGVQLPIMPLAALKALYG
jgi:5,10-methylenetetrahydromethanopterin reductase